MLCVQAAGGEVTVTVTGVLLEEGHPEEAIPKTTLIV
jgi:hypothetical protein